MAKYEFKLPHMGESVAEATITNWLKSVGDTIDIDDILVEVATDKVDSEIPSEVKGTLTEILFEKDQIVKVGQTMAIIQTEANETISDKKTSQSSEITTPTPKEVSVLENEIQQVTAQITNASGRFYSPLVKTIAKQENISQQELETIKGTGLDGRVTKNDVINFLKNRQTFTASSEKTSVQTLEQDGVEVVELTRMGKLISQYMVQSKQTSPHVQSFTEVDMTRIWKWRQKAKKNFEQREGEKFTFTPIFVEAVAKALRDFPMMNISTDGEKIFKKKNINIGMATALPNGDLIVPVIKNADQLSLIGLAKSVNDLANRARANKLKPEEIKGGTYTITNIGSFGNLFGTPIINQPEVGILAIGAIQKVPAVVETPEGDVIAIRYKMMLSHSYDHRVVNGALGGMFVQRVAHYLENWDTSREI